MTKMDLPKQRGIVVGAFVLECLLEGLADRISKQSRGLRDVFGMVGDIQVSNLKDAFSEGVKFCEMHLDNQKIEQATPDK